MDVPLIRRYVRRTCSMGRGFLDSMAADCLLAGRRDILCSGALQDVLRLANPIGIVAVHRQQNAPSLTRPS